MGVRKIVYFPDDPLTQVSRPIENFSDKLRLFVKDLYKTMHAFEGVGLAAPQVGIAKRIFVLQEPDGEPMCFVNPEILEMDGIEEGEEGCLSMPGVYAKVPRATRILVRAQEPTGELFEMEAEDFLARIIQHETDHLNGILFPERLDILSRQDKLDDWARLRDQKLAEQAAAENAPQ